jgi:hypothetical protein
MSKLIENTEAYIKKHFKILKLADTIKEEILEKYPTPQSFIDMYFDSLMPKTESVNKDGSTPKKVIITNRAKNRSIPDTYSLLRHYYPDVTLLVFLKHLKDRVSKQKIGQSYCPDIKRIVLYKGEYYTNVRFSHGEKKVWRSKYSPTFSDLVNCLNSNE